MTGEYEAGAEPLPSSTHIGFAQVALMKVLQRAKYPEREAWLEQFKGIETRTDAELFTVEAKLLLRHDIDFKRPRRGDRHSPIRFGRGGFSPGGGRGRRPIRGRGGRRLPCRGRRHRGDLAARHRSPGAVALFHDHMFGFDFHETARHRNASGGAECDVAAGLQGQGGAGL
jgi:hypothetical protein